MFDCMGALSTKRNAEPTTASRAFDKDRDGFVIAGAQPKSTGNQGKSMKNNEKHGIFKHFQAFSRLLLAFEAS